MGEEELFGWLKKSIVKKWMKELKQNIEGMRKMAEAYRSNGGFKEVAETIGKFGAENLFPKPLLEGGRKAELEFADACEKLANCYSKLLEIIEKAVKNL